MIGEQKNVPEINGSSFLALRSISEGLSPLQTFCSVMSLPSPLSQKTYDRINTKILSSMKDLTLSSVKKAVYEERSLTENPNAFTVCGDGNWKRRGHMSLIGACTLVGSEWPR
ncbi:uncharacterized protein NPIL_440101 [Nephila pilipes]|uniref:Mutator-like transposase domain-containing protein n=1 Tax=Nephila pilipes TaxID=299642 RepID=A0A8X6P057_NEPPI|nr:uncharacterized protein NPIL_440101 [Nephila pilipes]